MYKQATSGTQEFIHSLITFMIMLLILFSSPDSVISCLLLGKKSRCQKPKILTWKHKADKSHQHLF